MFSQMGSPLPRTPNQIILKWSNWSEWVKSLTMQWCNSKVLMCGSPLKQESEGRQLWRTSVGRSHVFLLSRDGNRETPRSDILARPIAHSTSAFNTLHLACTLSKLQFSCMSLFSEWRCLSIDNWTIDIYLCSAEVDRYDQEKHQIRIPFCTMTVLKG